MPKTKKVNIVYEIEIPDGATHYSGILSELECCHFYKSKKIGGFTHWFHYDNSLVSWILNGHSKPGHVKEIPIVSKVNEEFWNDERKADEAFWEKQHEVNEDEN